MSSLNVASISGRLSLRTPHLDRIREIVSLEDEAQRGLASSVIRNEFPSAAPARPVRSVSS